MPISIITLFTPLTDKAYSKETLRVEENMAREIRNGISVHDISSTYALQWSK